jgi:formate dehydrogenase major subunit
MTRRTANVDLQRGEALDIHPDDANRLALHDGARVEVASRRGKIVAPVRLTDDVAPGEVFLAFHFPDVATNVLTSQAVDEVTSCPEYKVTAVQLRNLDG